MHRDTSIGFPNTNHSHSISIAPISSNQFSKAQLRHQNHRSQHVQVATRVLPNGKETIKMPYTVSNSQSTNKQAACRGKKAGDIWGSKTTTTESANTRFEDYLEDQFASMSISKGEQNARDLNGGTSSGARYNLRSKSKK